MSDAAGFDGLPDFPVKAGTAFPEPVFCVEGLRSRSCRARDFPFLRRLYRHTRASELAHWPEEMKRPFCDQQFAAQHISYVRSFPDAAFLLLLRGGEPLGRLYVGDEGDDVRIIEISLLPSVRGKGLGSRLVRAVVDHAAASGRGVALSTDPYNGRAWALYQRLGFAEIGRDAARIHLRRPPEA